MEVEQTVKVRLNQADLVQAIEEFINKHTKYVYVSLDDDTSTEIRESFADNEIVVLVEMLSST